MQQQSISLVIPAYNEENYIGTCLEHVVKNSGGKFLETIVVINGCTDKTKEIAESYGVRVIQSEKGLRRAREKGLEEARGELVAYIDADTRMPAGWVDQALHVFSTRSDVVSLSGPARYYDGSWLTRASMKVIWWVTAPLTYFLVGYMILGTGFVVRADVLRKAGFSQDVEFYGEDTDIARRMSAFGKVLFKMNFVMYASSRRFTKEGLLKTNFVYALNYISQAIFKKSATKNYNDIRSS